MADDFRLISLRVSSELPPKLTDNLHRLLAEATEDFHRQSDELYALGFADVIGLNILPIFRMGQGCTGTFSSFINKSLL